MGRHKKLRLASYAGLSVKQERLVHALIDNRKLKKPKSLQTLFLECGYSESTSRTTGHIMKSKAVQTALGNFVDELRKKREAALYHLNDKKMTQATARDLAYITDTLTKNHQLLTGGETAREKIMYLPSELMDKYEIPKDEQTEKPPTV